MKAKVTVLTLVDGLYELVEYTEEERIVSSVLPGMELTVAQVLRGGK